MSKSERTKRSFILSQDPAVALEEDLRALQLHLHLYHLLPGVYQRHPVHRAIVPRYEPSTVSAYLQEKSA